MNRLFLLLLCSIVLFKATGQPGSLDPTFGNNGIQTTAFFYNNPNPSYDYGRVVLTNANGDVFVVVLVSAFNTGIAKYLPNGKPDSSYGNAGCSSVVELEVASAAFQGDKIIVGGKTGSYPNYDFTVARYTADGTLDSSFGNNGTIKTDYADAIALQGDKIIVAGSALVRYTADGTLDSSFGENGKVTTNFYDRYDPGSSWGVSSIAIQGNKIIMAGYIDYGNYDYRFGLARYTIDGSLDASFGENGEVINDAYEGVEAISIALQEDKILVAGNALTRYTADGALDASFGVNGKVIIDFNVRSLPLPEPRSIALQGDKIIVAGSSYTLDINIVHFALVRYTHDGTLDRSFGVNGLVTTDFSDNYDEARSITLQGDKIIATGYAYSFGYPEPVLGRYTTDGGLDSSFGKNGKLTVNFLRSQTFFTSTALQGDKIVAAGYTPNNNNNSDFALVRYLASGALDPSFGENGKVTTDFGNSGDRANAITLQEDKIIVAGSALVRYTADGVLDSSFGANGSVTTDFSINAIVLQGDKIIVGGTIYNSNLGIAFILARYTADGRFDSTFGVNGKVITDFGNSDDVASTIVLQGDMIIVAGNTGDYPNRDFALARYNPDGILDSSFGENGKVTTDFNNSDDYSSSIALQGDKIIAGGRTSGLNSDDFVLARYTANGILDSSFGENGKVTTDFNNSDDYSSSIALQGDKIIAGGSTLGLNNDDFAIARYTANGTPDSSFGENGKVITHLDGSSSINAIAVHENRLYAVGSLGSSGENYGVVAAYQLEAAEPSISIADVTVSESNKQAVVTVRLSAPASKWVGVRYTTKDKTALSPQDYQQVKGILHFAPGVTAIKVKIPVMDDNACEATEQFEVRLLKALNATIQDSVAIVTITDDDNALTAKQSTVLRIYATPNPSADAFTIQLLGSNLKQPVSIRVYDITGRLLEQRENISIGQSFRLGDQYKAGTYILEAVQGSRIVQTKVIKTGK